jgi:hypothetical protein
MPPIPRESPLFMANHGIDLDAIAKPVSRDFPWASSGRISLIQKLARSLMQPANSLPYWPGYGYDLKAAVGSNQLPEHIARNIERQFARFEGVTRSLINVTRDADGVLSIRCLIEDSEGPFEFVMSASVAAVKLISLLGIKVQNG